MIVRSRVNGPPCILLVAMMLLARPDSILWAQTPSPPSVPERGTANAADDAPPELAKLIAQLADPDFNVRDAAQRTIVKLGAEALPALDDASRTEDPELSTRALAAIQAIRGSMTATLVTLHLHDVTARQALDALVNETKIPITARDARPLAKLAKTRLTIDADRMPFWNIVLQICEAAGLRPETYMPNQPVPPVRPTRSPGRGTGNRVIAEGPTRIGNAPVPQQNSATAIQLTDLDGTWSARNTTVQGPIAISIVELDRHVELSYGKPDPLPGGVQLHLMVCPEPHLRAEQVLGAQVLKCVDESKFPIAPDPANQLNLMHFPAMFIITLHPEDSKKIALIEGKATLILADATQSIEVEDIANAKRAIRVASGVRIAFEECKQVDEHRWLLRVQIMRDGRDMVDFNPIVQRISKSTPRLEDSFGRAFVVDGGDRTPRQREGGVEFTIGFRNTGNNGRGQPTTPAKLTWDVPTSTREVTVAFRFKDIPLPR